MKKLLILIFLLFIPFMVYAENCETNKVTISDISLVENSDGVTEVSTASINGNSVSLNLSMKELNDRAKYRLTFKNDSSEDYEINNNTINSTSEYIEYELKTEDDINIVKSGTSKDAILLVTYKNEIPETMFTSNKYNDNQTLTINLSSESGEINNITNNIINPKTGYSYVFILIMCIIGFSLIYLILNKSKYSKYFVLLILLLPIGLKAICKVEVEVESNIEIEKPVISFLMTGTPTSSGNYLRTNIEKQSIEEITFVNSIEGHSVNGTDCFDVSKDEDGSVLAWVTDTDNNSKYEMTIGANGKVYAYSGYNLFYSLSNLKTISGMKYFDIRYVTSISSMFFNCSSLTSIDLRYFNTSNVIGMSSVFYGCHGLTSLDLSSFDTSNVTTMSEMFRGLRNVTTLDLSNFNTSKVTKMDGMFYLCTNLESVNLSSFDTSKVTTMATMFSSCKKLSTLNLSNFDTSKVTRMASMFEDSIINNLNISSFDTSKVQYMSRMFGWFSGMDSIDLSHFKTPSLLGTSEMFESSKFVSIDLSGFNTASLTNVREMFQNCTNLETIYASDKFVTTGVTVASSASNMFYGCTKLVGGSGTIYSGSPVDTTYAHIDGGTSNPGFFTLKTQP